jgi:hypothetical protein
MNARSKSIEPLQYQFDLTGHKTIRGGPRALVQSAQSPLLTTEFYLNDKFISKSFGRHINALLADLIDVALAAYLVDRLSPRQAADGRGSLQGARVLYLKLPVRNLDVWSKPEVVEELCNLLHFFSDDEWHFEFVARLKADQPAERQEFLFATPMPQPIRVALYSGGLDSFAGAVQQVSESPGQAFVFVSATTNYRQAAGQNEQMRIIRRIHSGEITHVPVPFGLKWQGKMISRVEASQRTRGFLFMALGAVTAMAAQSSTLHIYENGIGAINLPYDATQVGAHSTRAVHPLGLLRMGTFVERVTGHPFHFENPFLFATKGEMCGHPAFQSVAAFIPCTFSCDGFPVRTRNKPQCGSCTSCLLRRLSIQVAGLSAFDAGDRYIVDLLLPGNSISEQQLLPLRAMEWQYQRIKLRLPGPTPWRGLVTEFPELRSLTSELSWRTGAEADILQQSILRLYSRYVAEWESFSARRRLQTQARVA